MHKYKDYGTVGTISTQTETLVEAKHTVNLPEHGLNNIYHIYTKPSPNCMTLTIFEATNNSGGFLQ